MTEDIAELIARARSRDLAAAVELADLVEQVIENPDRRVRTALGLQRRKGGESAWRAERRAERDGSLRELARLIGAELSLEECADTIVRKAGRYLAAPHGTDDEGSAERRVLARIAETGLPVPGVRQLKRILTKINSDIQSGTVDVRNPTPPSPHDTGENHAGEGRRQP